MKRSTATLLALAAIATGARADSLYYIADETQDSMPLKWVLGMDVIWDDNVTPTIPFGPGADDEAFSINPYVGLAFVSNTPQTTWDIYARVGAIYYFDEPAAVGSDDLYEQARIGVNLVHRFSERLRFSSRNFLSYELEPDYSYGYANTRMTDPYFYWSTDNSVGYRWTERFATYTGINLTSLDYDNSIRNQDRFTWQVYNQFRYQLSPQSVLTFDYRYSETDADGVASDSTNQYLLAGIEHRFSPNTIGIVRAGAQLREMDAIGGEDSTSPYLEATLRSQVNDQFTVRAFARYGIEDWDTVFYPIEYTERTVFRLGVSGEYALSPVVSLFGGLDYIPSDYDGARNVVTNLPMFVNPSEDIFNAYIGLSYKITDYLYASASYNYTNSSSDIPSRDYDRNRVSIGLRAEF